MLATHHDGWSCFFLCPSKEDQLVLNVLIITLAHEFYANRCQGVVIVNEFPFAEIKRKHFNGGLTPVGDFWSRSGMKRFICMGVRAVKITFNAFYGTGTAGIKIIQTAIGFIAKVRATYCGWDCIFCWFLQAILFFFSYCPEKKIDLFSFSVCAYLWASAITKPRRARKYYSPSPVPHRLFLSSLFSFSNWLSNVRKRFVRSNKDGSHSIRLHFIHWTARDNRLDAVVCSP